MCRSIHTLYNIDPPVTDAEVRAAALQFVRKISGYNKPSKANEQAFMHAVDKVEAASLELLVSLHTASPVRERSALVHNRI